MKALGYALLFSALIGGGGVLVNFVSRMNADECRKKCPTQPGALKERFAFGPFALVQCVCGEIEGDATGEDQE